MIDQPSSVSPTPPDDRPRIEPTAAHRRSLWMAYMLAALLPLAILIVRLALGFSEGDPPLLILFTFPIVVSAYVGGLGPGLLATVLATLLSNYVLLPPQYAFSLTTRLTLLQSGGLLGAGILISVLSEELHRARVQAETGQRLQALTLASIGDGVITTDTLGQITFLNPEAERLTGWNSAEAIGQPLAAVFRLMNAHTRAPIDDPVTKVLRSGTVVGLANHTILIGRDGRETVIDDSGAPITAVDATVQGVVLVFRDVTEREQADRALRESQERLAGIVGAAMDAIISIDATQRIVIFNAAAEQMFGCPAAAAIGQSLDRFVPARFHGVHAAHIQAFGQTGVTSRSMQSPTPLTALRADGTEFPIEATIAQTVAAAQPLYTVIMRDISARIQAEVALHASEQRYRQIVETAQEGVWQIDAANRTTFVNARMAAMLGYTMDEMIGAPLFDFLDAEGQAIAAANLERRRQGIPEQYDVTFRRKDGSDVWALISTNPILDRVGTYAGALVMVTDITARKRDEQELRLSEARFATAFRASPIAMSITSLVDGRFIDINTSHERLFGYTRDELVGQTTDGISIYADPKTRAEVIQSIRAHGSLSETDLTLRTKSGELREVLCSLAAIEVEGEACILGSVFDITERKQAERQLARSTERLRILADASQAFAEAGGDIQTVLDRIAFIVATKLQAATTIRLLSDDGAWLDVAALGHYHSAEEADWRQYVGTWRVPMDSRVPAAIVVRTGQPQFMPVVDSEEQRRAMPALERRLWDRFAPHSLMVIALTLDGRSVGSLALIRSANELPAFDTDDLTLAQNLADRAALAIGNARLFAQVQAELAERTKAEMALRESEEQLTRSTERLQILATASRLFAEGFSEDEVLFERIARTIGEALQDFCGIRMISDDGQWLNTVALYNATADPLDSLQTTIAATPVPVAAIPSLHATMQGDQALLMPLLDPAQIQSTLRDRADGPDLTQINDYDRVVAPLRVGGQPIGVIGVTHKRTAGDPYDEDDLRLVQDLADRAALAISNARLYQELQQSHAALEARVAARTTELASANTTLQQQAMQASALATMSRALAEAGRELQPLFDTIVRHLAMLLGDTCVLSILSADRQWMQPVASHNVDTERNALIRSLLAGMPNRADAGWSAPVVATGQALLLPHIPVADVRTQVNPRYHPYFETVDALSLLIVPLRAHGTLLGMLTALRVRPDQPYTVDDQALLQDLADRAGLAIENARLFAEAEQARTEAVQASTAKDAFLASMSHELRTPLNAILGFTGTLLMKLPGPLTAEQEKQLTTVQRSGKHLLNLINDILDLAKIESGKVELRSERVVCQAVIDEVMTTLRPLAEQKGLRCTVMAPAEALVIASDQRVLSQILINLVNNAIKFTDRGEVQIALAREANDGHDRVTIRVIDTGMGIAADDQAKLFQDFGRVNSDAVRSREGTGLGLRLSRKLAELLGGTITLTSELGNGSTFTLVLPGG